MMNGVLLSEGYDAISVPAASRLDFNNRMVAFYDTKDATAMISFLAECSLDRTLQHIPRRDAPRRNARSPRR